jgi:transposase
MDTDTNHPRLRQRPSRTRTPSTGQTLPARTVQRARIILLSADGHTGREVATLVGCTQQSVVAWRNRYEKEGLAGLEDRPRSGRPAQIDAQKRSEVVAKTLKPPPAKLGVTHWTSRLMEREVGLDHSTIARI